MQRLYYIDVLKAIAIIVVVLYHMGYLPYGYLGVDLFLVINGYLVTNGLRKKLILGESTVSFNTVVNHYLTFIFDKVCRLLPVLLVGCVFCVLWGYVCMLPDDYENLSQSVISTSLFSNNILQAITTRNYWDVVNDFKPLMHTWYVGIIMQFYLIFPLLFYISRIKSANPNKTFVSILSVLTFISLLIYFGTDNVATRFYYLPSRFFEFGVGGLVAVFFDTKNSNRIFSTAFSVTCLAVTILSFVLTKEFIPDVVRLVLVVGLSVCLLLCRYNFECTSLRTIVANKNVACIGAMSYSIFVWHQILLAFYRYSFSCHFTIITFILYFAIVSIVSLLSYELIEKFTSIQIKQSKKKVLLVLLPIFLGVNSLAIYIYANAGIVRDIPELNVSMVDRHRGQHAEYCDRANSYNKDFTTDKIHWLVIGNSFGRDFVNVILESSISDSIEVSYCKEEEALASIDESRFVKADCIFISSLGITQSFVANIRAKVAALGCDMSKVYIVGEKNFGESNGQIYWRRNNPDYFFSTTDMMPGFNSRNETFKKLYGEKFIDLISVVSVGENSVRVFTDDKKIISSDCRHLTQAGAMFYAQKLALKDFLQ